MNVLSCMACGLWSFFLTNFKKQKKEVINLSCMFFVYTIHKHVMIKLVLNCT